MDWAVFRLLVALLRGNYPGAFARRLTVITGRNRPVIMLPANQVAAL